MDDTPEDEHFTFLRDTLSHDNRIRLYKRDKKVRYITIEPEPICELDKTVVLLNTKVRAFILALFTFNATCFLEFGSAIVIQ